jgi:adenine phosphoribosyltransferase
MIQAKKDYIRSRIITVPDFPQPGVSYRDLNPVFNDSKAFGYAIDLMVELCADKKIDVIAPIEARGYIFGAAMADRMNVGMALVRKPGKLPREKIVFRANKEYGENLFEMQKDSIKPNQNVLVADDVLASGGTVHATTRTVENEFSAKVACAVFLIELRYLHGREVLNGYDVRTVLEYSEP